MTDRGSGKVKYRAFSDPTGWPNFSAMDAILFRIVGILELVEHI
jgi:hypothetical protein